MAHPGSADGASFGGDHNIGQSLTLVGQRGQLVFLEAEAFIRIHAFDNDLDLN